MQTMGETWKMSRVPVHRGLQIPQTGFSRLENHFFAGGLFLETVYEGSTSTWPLGLQISHDCHLQPQIWQRFFRFLKLQSAEFVTWTAQVSACHWRHCPKTRHRQGTLPALPTKGSLGSWKYSLSTSGPSPPARADTEQMEIWLIWWSQTPPSSWLTAAVPQHSRGMLAGGSGDRVRGNHPLQPLRPRVSISQEWEAEAPKIEEACPKAVYKVRCIKKPKAQTALSRAAPSLNVLPKGCKIRKKQLKSRKSIFFLHLLWKTQVSDSTTTFNLL